MTLVVRGKMTEGQCLRIIAGEELPADVQESFYQNAEVEDMEELGVSSEAALRLLAARELYAPKKQSRRYKGTLDTTGADVAALARDMAELRAEQLRFIYLDGSKVIEIETHINLALDDKFRVPFDVRRVAVKARGYKATGVAMVHNHPGERKKVYPSTHDDHAVALLCQELGREGITLLDSVIVASGLPHFSYADSERLVD